MLNNMYAVARTRVPNGNLVTIFNADIAKPNGELKTFYRGFHKLKIFQPTIQRVDKPRLILSHEVLTLSKEDNGIDEPFFMYRERGPQVYDKFTNFVDKIQKDEVHGILLWGNGDKAVAIISDISEEVKQQCWSLYLISKKRSEVNKFNKRIHIYSGEKNGLTDDELDESFDEFNRIACQNYDPINQRFNTLYYETRRLVKGMRKKK